MPNRHLLIKLWQCQKAVSILTHEAKPLLELFCLQTIVFGWRQNSSSSSFASWDKIKIPDFTWADQDWIGLMIFKNLADQDWIGFNFIGSGLDSDWKISQSVHLWRPCLRYRMFLTYLREKSIFKMRVCRKSAVSLFIV